VTTVFSAMELIAAVGEAAPSMKVIPASIALPMGAAVIRGVCAWDAPGMLSAMAYAIPAKPVLSVRGRIIARVRPTARTWGVARAVSAAGMAETCA